MNIATIGQIAQIIEENVGPDATGYDAAGVIVEKLAERGFVVAPRSVIADSRIHVVGSCEASRFIEGFGAKRETPADVLLKKIDEILEVWPQMSDWLPIKDAPKDGTNVLVFSADSADLIYIAHWSVAENSAMSNGDGWYDRETGYPFDVELTHWMPLPAAPLPSTYRDHCRDRIGTE